MSSSLSRGTQSSSTFGTVMVDGISCASKNTVFVVSHDVLVEGRALLAGRCGLHMIPGETLNMPVTA